MKTLRFFRTTFCLLLLSLLAAITSNAMENAVEDNLMQSTFRIRHQIHKDGYVVTGHGTAFGFDASAYGYDNRHYLLTVSHNVLDESGRPLSILELELTPGVWSPCRVTAFDKNLDLCLVETSQALPRVMKLSEMELASGDSVWMAGSPRGVPVGLYKGTVLERFERGSVRTLMEIPFDHGDSGGPVINPKTGRITGVAVAGIPKNGDLDHTVGLFVPVLAISSFLDGNRVAGFKPAPSAAAALASNPEIPTGAQSKIVDAKISEPVAVSRPVFVIDTESSETITLAAKQAPVPPPAPAPVKIEKPEVKQVAVVKIPSNNLAAAASISVPAAPAPVRIAMAAPIHAASAPVTAPAITVAAAPIPATASKPVAPTVSVVTAAATPTNAKATHVHLIQPGDSLSSISKTYAVSMASLIQTNGIKDPNRILVGYKLIIPAM